MPDTDWRIDKAEDLEVLYEDLRDDDHGYGNTLTEWSAVIAFYTALHYCSALLAVNFPPERFDSHNKRNGLLSNRYRDLWKHYRLLSQCAHQVRYQEAPLRPDEHEAVAENLRFLAQKCRRKLDLPG